MATITRRELTTYAGARRRIADASKSAVSLLMPEIDLDDVSGTRQKTIQALNSVLPDSTAASAQLAAEFYDMVRERAVGEAMGAQSIPDWDPYVTSRFVHAAADDLVKGKPDSFTTKVLQRVDYEVQRAAGNSTMRNGWRDRELVRYARVPTGRETCAFCIMLASRGAVYYSKETAGIRQGHYHSNCDCVIVPEFTYFPLSIEGYDTDDYLNQYYEMLEGGTLDRASLRESAKAAKKRNGVSSRVAGTEGTQFPSGVKEMRRYINEASDMDDFYIRVGVVRRDFNAFWADKRDWEVLRNHILHDEERLSKKFSK